MAQLKNKNALKHGLCPRGKNRMHNIYQNLRRRCINILNKDYKNYGGRGIRCLWLNFVQFHKDMNPTYLEHLKVYGEKNTTLDRVDNAGNYCKENCRWATLKQQANNKRRNIL